MATDRKKILVTRMLPEAVQTRLTRDYDAVLNPNDEIMTSDALLAAADGVDGLVVCATEKLTADVIQHLADSVKIVTTFSVGYEHIDLDAATSRGLVVTNTPDVLTSATADIAMLCLLGAARRAYEGERLVREKRWTGWYSTMLLGIEVSGKRLGILGMGRIGQALAQRARGFDIEVHYHNRKQLPPAAEQGAIFHRTVEGLLRHSDFLSINCPVNEDTRGFLNDKRIALLPDGAVVVNTARGEIVDDEALIAALKSGKVAAAGLDVFAGEPKIHPGYRELPNTFLLPHMGSATLETRNAMGFVCCDNLDAFFAGKPCPTAIT